MRLQLIRLVVLAAVLLPTLARAEPFQPSSIVVRGNYYRDRNTRILQPTVDMQKELRTGTIVGAHYLLDAITSASVAAGVLRDEPFTEMRNEVGFRLGQRIGPATLLGRYSYSSESDYQAHTAVLTGLVDLFQRNTTLGLSLAYGHDYAARRMGPTMYSRLGELDTLRLIATVTQVLTQRLVLGASYDLGVIGFGTKENGFQANPYRPVLLGGSPTPEQVPMQRIKHSLAASLQWMIPTPSRITPWVVLKPSYRFYLDDWSVTSHTPELRVYVPIGPTELRLTGRYYWQGAASFWNEVDGMPSYPGNTGKPCTSCNLQAPELTYYTADPKLGNMTTGFLELRFLLQLGFLRRLSSWLADGYIAASYGHYFQTGWAETTWGSAEIAGLELMFPL